MAISDVVISSIATGIVGFSLGIVLHENLKNWFYYKFVRSPLEISSNHFDTSGRIGGMWTWNTAFMDTLTITNVSDTPIRVRRIGIDKKILKNTGSRVVLASFLFRDYNKLIKSMGLNTTGLKEWMKETSVQDELVNPYTAKLGEISTYKQFGPHIAGADTGSITINPNEQANLYLGVLCLTDLDKFIIPVDVTVYPVSDYKNPKIPYKITFYKGMTFEPRNGHLYLISD